MEARESQPASEASLSRRRRGQGHLPSAQQLAATVREGELFAFAGLWTPWRGVRGPKSALIEGEHQLFGFLTTEANAVVAPIHPKAMPVILTSAAEVDGWLEGDISDALALQRPLPDGALKIVATGEKEDATLL